jgi:N-acetyl-beta-hexosaminidase
MLKLTIGDDVFDEVPEIRVESRYDSSSQFIHILGGEIVTKYWKKSTD